MSSQHVATSPEVIVTNNDSSTNELVNIRQTDCQLGEYKRSSCKLSPASTKAKRKALSTRRRLNAMINNTSLHFSDTDSEGELTVPRISIPNHKTRPASASYDLLQPVISVTLDGSDNSSYGGSRRGSYLESLTDVDEIYTSEPETINGVIKRNGTAAGSLAIVEPVHQGETDLEDVSNDEEEVVQATIYIKPRSDILVDFNGETITTKEGDGPFSVEIRNQMSVDEPGIQAKSRTPDIMVLPTTDSEDMEASDEDEEPEGACGQQRDTFEDFHVLDASQIVMTNVSKMDQRLSAKEPDEHDAISDCHTDVEDIE